MFSISSQIYGKFIKIKDLFFRIKGADLGFRSDFS